MVYTKPFQENTRQMVKADIWFCRKVLALNGVFIACLSNESFRVQRKDQIAQVMTTHSKVASSSTWLLVRRQCK